MCAISTETSSPPSSWAEARHDGPAAPGVRALSGGGASAFERGLRAAKARDTAAAEACFREAHAERPGDARVRAWLGQSLCANGARIEGIGHLVAAAQSLAQDGAARTMRVEIVRQLQHWSAFAEARDLLDALVAQVGGDPELLLMRAATLSLLNRPDEALDDARGAGRLAPGNAMTEVFLASLEADAGAAADAERRLVRVLQASPGARETFRGLKELARLFDRRGAYAKAFACLEQAGQAAAHVPEYAQVDRTLLPRIVAENRAGFTRDLVRRWQGIDFADRAAPIFVLGFFRSGTTLTQEVMAAHPGLFVADEAGFAADLTRELARLAPAPATTAERLATLDRAGIKALRDCYWRAVVGRFGPVALDRRFIDKFTMNTIDVAMLGTIFPDARILFMVRDPRDVCVSCFQQLMVPTPATVHLLDWRGTATFYAQVVDWWRHIRPQLATPVLEIRYEDAVGDFERTYRRVFAFAGVDWADEALDFHRRAAGKYISTPSRGQVAQPLYTGARERWRNYAAETAAIAPILAPALDAFGYRE